MRKATTLFAILASMLFFMFGLSTPASADPNSPGNNGTVKVHDADTSVEDMRNEPHVCHFYVDGFKFDDLSTGQWWIESWPPTGNRTEVMREGWTANGQGDWHSGIKTLADGHYKLYAKQQNELSPGGNKQKVFWVECSTGSTPASAPRSTPPSTTVTTTVGGTTTIVDDTTTTVGGTTTIMTSGGTTTTTGGVTTTVGGTTTIVGNTTSTVGGTTTVAGGTAVRGFESAPNGGAAGAVAGVENLPSTNTDSGPTAPLALMGLAIMGAGGLLLRRRDAQL